MWGLFGGSGWGIRVSPNGMGQNICCLADIALGHLAALVNVLLWGWGASFISVSRLSKTFGLSLQSCVDEFPCWDDSVGQ